MKKTVFASSIFALSLLFSLSMSAQDFKGLDVSPMDASCYPVSHNISEKLVKVIYSRPQLRGRLVENLAPTVEVWRTGANEATEITFYEDVMFGDKPVNAGVYSFFTIPGEKEWTVIINSDIDVWGAYNYNADNDVARVKIPVKEQESFVEAFCIAFDDKATMHIAWGHLRIPVPIKKK